MVFLIALSFVVASPAFAKKDGGPAGWAKGEKKGWSGENTPPGLDKKNAAKAEKEARKKAKEAEKEARKKAKEAEKAAKKAEREAKEAAKKATT